MTELVASKLAAPTVVIVGAGPTGATLALLLSQRGIAVTLVEAARNFRRIFRGEALMPSGLAALEQMGLLPLLETLPHRSLDAWEFVINDRALFRAPEPFEPGGRACTLVSQPAFLEAVIQRCQAFPQFTFLSGSAVQDLLWQSELRSVDAVDAPPIASGTETAPNQGDRVAGIKLSEGRRIEADLVIATDGRNSLLRQRAQLSLTEAPHEFDLRWFQLPDHPRLQTESVFTSYLKGTQGFGLFRSAEGNLQLGLICPIDRTRSPEMGGSAMGRSALLEAAPDWLAQHCQRHAAAIEKSTFLPVLIGFCPQWFRPGLLLLGDAAHPMSPIRAQGINMALRDAIVAVNHLVPVLLAGADRPPVRHAAIDATLPQIQNDRSPEIQRIQQLQAEETQLADRLRRNPVLRSLVSLSSPWFSLPLQQIWQRKQRSLRQGTIDLRLHKI